MIQNELCKCFQWIGRVSPFIFTFSLPHFHFHMNWQCYCIDFELISAPMLVFNEPFLSDQTLFVLTL